MGVHLCELMRERNFFVPDAIAEIFSYLSSSQVQRVQKRFVTPSEAEEVTEVGKMLFVRDYTTFKTMDRPYVVANFLKLWLN